MSFEEQMRENAKKKLKFLERFRNEMGISRSEFLLLIMAVSGAIKLETVDEDEGAPVMANTHKLLAILHVIENAIGLEAAGERFNSMTEDELEKLIDGEIPNPFDDI